VSNAIAERFKRFAAAHHGSVYIDATPVLIQQNAAINGTVHPDQLLGPSGLSQTPEIGLVRMTIPTKPGNHSHLFSITTGMLEQFGLCTRGPRCEVIASPGVTITDGINGITIVYDPRPLPGTHAQPFEKQLG
jgi:hypothetical protein